MLGQKPNNRNYSLPERSFYTKFRAKKRSRGWKIGLGIGATILLLAIILFSKQIDQLLSLWGIKAQVPGAPVITLSLEPMEQTGGPAGEIPPNNVKEYKINIQIEHGTYDGDGITPLPFLGTIRFKVMEDLASLYPKFIESATITVPEMGYPGDDGIDPMITVLDDLNAFGLYKNRRLSPADNEFILDPPKLTLVLKDYPLSEGGGQIDFHVGVDEINYMPRIGGQIIYPIGWIPPVVQPPLPAAGILHLEGGIPPQPDFSLIIKPPKDQTVNSGQTAIFDIEVTSLNDFSGTVVLSTPGLNGFKGASGCLDDFTLVPNAVTLIAGETKPAVLTIFTRSDLTETWENIPIIVSGTSDIMIMELDPDTGEIIFVLKTVTHTDNGTLTINPVPDYALSIVPLTHTVSPTAPGNSAVYEVRILRVGGFVGPVSFSADELTNQTGVGSVVFAQNLVKDPSGNIYDMTVTANGTVFNADYPFYVKGTTPDLGGLPAERWAPNKLAGPPPEPPAHFIIQSTPGYTLDIVEPSQNVFAGNTATYTIKIQDFVNGFNEPIRLSDDILTNYSDYVEPNGVSYDQNPITNETLLHIHTKEGVSHPGFTFTVYGNSTPPNPTLYRFDTSILAIGVAPDFSLSIVPLTHTVSPTAPGNSAVYEVRILRVGGFVGPVSFSADELTNQTGVGSVVFAQNLVKDPLGNIYDMTVTANGTVFNADYPFYVKGTTPDLGGLPAERWAPNKLAGPPPELPAHFIIQSTPDFAIDIEPPTTKTVHPGETANYHIRLTRFNGYSGTVTLSHNLISLFVVTPLVFDDPILEEGQNDTYLRVTATNPADNSTLPFKVFGQGIVSGNPATRETDGTFIIENLFDYRLSINPASRTVAPGGITTYTVTLTREFLFPGPVSLTTNLGSMVGVQSAVFNPETLSGGVMTSTLTVTANSSASDAAHVFTVYGATPDLNGSPAQRTTQATFVIENNEDFNIEVTPNTLTVAPGGTASYDVTLIPINNYPGSVTLSNNLLSVYGDYIQSATFGTTVLRPSSPTTKLWVTAKSDIPNYDILDFIVTGTGLVEGINQDRSDYADLLIRNPFDYRLSISPLSRTVAPGGVTTYTVTLTREFLFTGPVSLTTNLDSMVGVQSAVFNPETLSGGVMTSTLTVTANSSASDATHVFTVYGDTPDLNGSPAQKTTQATFVIENNEDFTISISPKTKSVAPGRTTTYDITVTRLNNFTGTISLSTDLGSKIGIQSALFTDNTLDSTETATALNVITLATVPTVDIPFLVIGSGSPEGIPTIRQDTATLNVVDFRITIDPNSQTVTPGGATSYTVNLTRLNGFTGTVNLTTDLGTKNYIASAILADTALNGAESSTSLNVTTLSPAPDLDINFTVTGDSSVEVAPLSHQATALLRLLTPTIPDFTITVIPENQTVNSAGSTTYDVLLHRLNGFDKSVTLSENLLSNYPDYIASATFGLDVLPDGTTDQTTVLYVTAKDVIGGNIDLPFVVTGKETATGLPEHSDNATLSIIGDTPPPPPPPPPVPDFTIKITPDLREVDAGGSTDYTITVTPINNFNDKVILTHNLLSDFGDYISKVDFDVLQLDIDNNYTTTMHVETKNISNSHILTFTITGTAISGSPIHSDNADLQINVAGSPPPAGGGGGGGTYTPPAPTTGGSTEDFTIQVTPLTNTTIYPGQTATYQITIIRLGGFTGPVTLSTDVLRLNYDVASATFGKTTVPAGETTTTLLLVARSNAVIDSSTLFNVQGNSSTLGDRNDDAPVAIIIPRGLPSTGPVTPPSPWFWLTIMGIAWLSWAQLHTPKSRQVK